MPQILAYDRGRQCIDHYASFLSLSLFFTRKPCVTASDRMIFVFKVGIVSLCTLNVKPKNYFTSKVRIDSIMNRNKVFTEPATVTRHRKGFTAMDWIQVIILILIFLCLVTILTTIIIIIIKTQATVASVNDRKSVLK